MKDNFFHLSTPEQLLFFMNQNIQYGWFDFSFHLHRSMNQFKNQYRVADPYFCIEKGYGTCIEQVEIERLFFKQKKIEYRTYVIFFQAQEKPRLHCFLVYKKNNYYYLFEHSWQIYRGITTFSSLQEIIHCMKQRMILQEHLQLSDLPNIKVYPYEQPPTGLSYNGLLHFFQYG